MMNWINGNGLQKYWVTRLIIESTEMGDIFRNTTTDSKQLYAQAFTHKNGARRVLLINKQEANTTVMLAGAMSAQVIDDMSAENPPRNMTNLGGTITLAPFATAVLVVDSAETLAHQSQ